MQVSGDGTLSCQQFELPYLLKLASLEQKLEDVKTAYCSKYSYANGLASLEAKLCEVGSLYCKKYGEELRDAEGDVEEDEDGALWMQVSGDGTLSSQQFERPYLVKLASLEQKLKDVKTAYCSKYSYANGLASLEAKLGEIESLYFKKYGEALHDSEGETVEDEDRALWIQVSGDGTQSFQQFEPTYLLKLASLEQKLEDVKTAYCSKYSYANSLAGLETKLDEIEYLFVKKYGEESGHAESEAEEDEDGALWMQVSGDGTSSSQPFEPPYLVKLASLEQKLEDAKTSYCSKYGLDAEIITGSNKDSYAKCLSGLEAKLGEIESLFAKKYGEELRDAAGEAEEDEDGALWTEVSGEGTGSFQQFELPYLVKLASLEQTLGDVKTAYCSKCSCTVDADEVMVSNTAR